MRFCSPDAIRERSSRRLTNSPDFIRATGSLSVGCAVRTINRRAGARSAPYGRAL
jgi:hypothetical protein